MFRVVIVLLGLLFASSVSAASESAMSLLDNRFRIDPSITEITFVIYRAEPSQPVVLVRPDGHKYYAWNHGANIRWYEEAAMDIITVENPMPGPWQAVGKVTPKNNIQFITGLKMTTDTFPERLYHGEELKFTARLTVHDKPLLLKDFLDRVHLKVTFAKFIEDQEALAKDAQPVPEVVGNFADDGLGLDENAGDGVFTVALPVTPEPGKYRVRITTGNGVFLRAQEQVVLVYPDPITTTFIQGRTVTQNNQVVFQGEQGMISPGSLAAHVEHVNPEHKTYAVEGQAEKSSLKLSLTIPHSAKAGQYQWSGKLYATDLASGRALFFPVKTHSYSVIDMNLAETHRLQQEALDNQRKLEQEQHIRDAQEAEKRHRLIVIAAGNVIVLVLVLTVGLILRRLKAKRAARESVNPEQLNV